MRSITRSNSISFYGILRIKSILTVLCAPEWYKEHFWEDVALLSTLHKSTSFYHATAIVSHLCWTFYSSPFGFSSFISYKLQAKTLWVSVCLGKLYPVGVSLTQSISHHHQRVVRCSLSHQQFITSFITSH